MSGQSSSVRRRVEGGERSPRNLEGGETERGEVGHFPISKITFDHILCFLLACLRSFWMWKQQESRIPWFHFFCHWRSLSISGLGQFASVLWLSSTCPIFVSIYILMMILLPNICLNLHLYDDPPAQYLSIFVNISQYLSQYLHLDDDPPAQAARTVRSPMPTLSPTMLPPIPLLRAKMERFARWETFSTLSALRQYWQNFNKSFISGFDVWPRGRNLQSEVYPEQMLKAPLRKYSEIFWKIFLLPWQIIQSVCWKHSNDHKPTVTFSRT